MADLRKEMQNSGSREGMREKFGEMRAEQNKEMKKILTDDQYKKYEKYLEERRARREPPPLLYRGCQEDSVDPVEAQEEYREEHGEPQGDEGYRIRDQSSIQGPISRWTIAAKRRCSEAGAGHPRGHC